MTKLKNQKNNFITETIKIIIQLLKINRKNCNKILKINKAVQKKNWKKKNKVKNNYRFLKNSKMREKVISKMNYQFKRPQIKQINQKKPKFQHNLQIFNKNKIFPQRTLL